MSVRRKKNCSGRGSIVVVSKAGGQYKELKTIGISSDAAETERLCKQGLAWVKQNNGQDDMFDKAEQAAFE